MAKILNHRRCGNTTRQVDEWVQELFENNEVVVVDHAHREGNYANKHAERMLFNRLYNEHGLKVGKISQLHWDEKSRKLSLTPF